MLPFIVIFFGTYTAMNGYLLWRIWSAFHTGWWLIPIGGFLLIMLFAPIACAILDNRGHEGAAKALGAIGYPWMAVVFWFVALMAVADVYNLIVHGVALGAPGARAALLPLPKTLIAIAAIIVVLMASGLHEARRIVRHNVELQAGGMPDGRETLTIAQISDLHLGMHTGQGRLGEVLDILREAKPDIIVSTGDLLDGPLQDVRQFAAELAQVPAPLGKYAIFGNHEFYSGQRQSMEFHRVAGFEVLRQETRTVGGVLMVGVDDPAGRSFNHAKLDDELPVLPPAGNRPLTILLKHRPTIEPRALGRFDLQLSGHTHGGQVFPWHAITAAMFKYYRGLHDVGSGSSLYVNRGAGTWGPPIRLLSTPEVTIITIKKN